jgi:hypothetical protein
MLFDEALKGSGVYKFADHRLFGVFVKRQDARDSRCVREIAMGKTTLIF